MEFIQKININALIFYKKHISKCFLCHFYTLLFFFIDELINNGYYRVKNERMKKMTVNQLADQYAETAKILKKRQKELKQRIKNKDYMIGEQLYARINIITTEYNALMRTAGILRKHSKRII